MKRSEIRIFAYITIALAGLIWVSIVKYSGIPAFSIQGLKALVKTPTPILILWAGYFSWAWRWPYIRRIMYRPDLNGSWVGRFKSDWKDEKGEEVPPGPFVLVIRQNFFALSIRAFTKKQKTSSYVESLDVNGDRGTKILAYLYSERRVADAEHGTRQGAADLELIEETTRRILEGDFWTLNRTTGQIRVLQKSKNEYVESFDEAVDKWPNHDSWIRVVG